MIFKITPKKLVKKALKKGYNKKDLTWVINHPYVIFKYNVVKGEFLDIKCIESYENIPMTCFKDRPIDSLKYLELYCMRGNSVQLLGECD